VSYADEHKAQLTREGFARGALHEWAANGGSERLFSKIRHTPLDEDNVDDTLTVPMGAGELQLIVYVEFRESTGRKG